MKLYHNEEEIHKIQTNGKESEHIKDYFKILKFQNVYLDASGPAGNIKDWVGSVAHIRRWSKKDTKLDLNSLKSRCLPVLRGGKGVTRNEFVIH